jgi:hypothetical protein
MSAPLTTTNSSPRPAFRAAGACGAVAAALILAAPSVSGPAGAVIWIVGFLLLFPFFAGLATLAHTAGGRSAWLAPAITAAGALLVAIHLVNIGVEYTANNLSTSSPVHEPLHEIGGALFVLGMLPFGVALVAAAIVGLRGGALPRWLAGGGLAIGLTALVNGTMLGSEAAWGFLLSLLWVLVAGVTVAVRRPHVVSESQLTATVG